MPRRLINAALVATAVLVSIQGFRTEAGEARAGAGAATEGSNVTIHYLEIVSKDADALCATYERVHGVSFGEEEPDLGQARVATLPDGSLVGIRKPLAEHDLPTMRTYLEVADIQKAVEEAQEAGAVLAYQATQGEWGTFAIFIHGEVQHGLWQR